MGKAKKAKKKATTGKKAVAKKATAQTARRKAAAKKASPARANPTRATATKATAKKRSAKRNELRTLAEYFESVAAGSKNMELDRALDTYISMYEHEDHLAHDKLKQEARDVLDQGRLAEAMELATRRKIVGLAEGTLRETLVRIAASERYIPIEE